MSFDSAGVIAQQRGIGWFGVIRLGLVQTAIGAIVILTTSTLNRVMVVELALPALIPGLLVGWHYAVQLSRPRWGYGADIGGDRTVWIIGGMGVLASGGVIAAAATAVMAASTALGVALAAAGFLLIGVGVGAAGTNLLTLLATLTAPSRKAAAAAIVWIMMIMGFVITAGVAGGLLEPFSMARLLGVTASVSVLAFGLATLAIWGLEKRGAAIRNETRADLRRENRALAQAANAGRADAPRAAAGAAQADAGQAAFRMALSEVWRERGARRFTVFIFVSMLAYSAQDLILEPFAGIVHGYSPGESTRLASFQNMGVLAGMIATAIVGTTIGRSRARFMRLWTAAGCVASAAALFALCFAALVGPSWPLRQSVFGLGVANGAFAVAAIGSMMALASAGRGSREGTRMGLWGASQAIAFGLGGFLGAVAADAARALLAEAGAAFALVFASQGVLFILSAWLALRVGPVQTDTMRLPALPTGESLAAE